MNPHHITGTAPVCGIVGQPVWHSLSPVLHNAWLTEGEVDGVYVAFGPRDEAGFDALVAAGRAGLIRGVNVTAPFKASALAHADTASAAARTCGSANLLIFADGAIHAESFDGHGLMTALAEQAPALDIAGRPVVVLGAGGAARAGAAALAEAGAEVRILNRTTERAEVLAADLGGMVRVADGLDALDDAVLVVNALSAAPDIGIERLHRDIVLMDMGYTPVITPFLAAGRARGLTVVDGLAMLIGQARPSFETLYGVAPPRDFDVRAIAVAAQQVRDAAGARAAAA